MQRLRAHILGESVLLAVSGGIDSVVMAHLVCDKLRKSLPPALPTPEGVVTALSGPVPAGSGSPSGRCAVSNRLAIAHCNFGLRGEESDADEAFVRDFAASLGLECFVEHFDTREFASANGISIEMAARELRYRWFSKLCDIYGFEGVCVAHNANDNAETLILNLLRGTGLRGISGMAEISRNPYGEHKVYRPMLAVSRRDIRSYAERHGLQWREDSTNRLNDCKRNIIRNSVFPLFESINPSFVETLNRDMENFRSGDDGLAAQMLSCSFNGATIRQAQELMASDNFQAGKRFYSPSHVLVTTSDGYEIYPLHQNGAGMEDISISRELWNPGTDPRVPRGTSLVDAAKIRGEAVLRPWEAGDYLVPIGMKGKKKVSDILCERKYDMVRKQGAMVLVSSEDAGHHVLAVVGEVTDRSVAIDHTTTEVYRIKNQRYV